VNFQNLEITCHFGLPPIFKEFGPVCWLSLHYLVPRLSPGEHEAAGGTHGSIKGEANTQANRQGKYEGISKGNVHTRRNGHERRGVMSEQTN